MKVKHFLILIFPAFLFSCMTLPKDIAYFQDLDKYKQNIPMGNDWVAYEPVIKKSDELLITITAPTLDQANIAQFNLPLTAYLTPGEETNVQQSITVQTYIVDNNGNIDFPVVGQIALAGLTKLQAVEHIKKIVSKYLSSGEPIVNLKILSFKVTVLGEVLKPGVIPVSQDKITILEAIGAANDLTIYGNRKNVLLIRENSNGSLDYITFDLTKSDLFTSPYYYLQQNDVIVVSPNQTRQLESKYGVADGYKLSVYSMVFSAVSVIASTAIAIISLSKR